MANRAEFSKKTKAARFLHAGGCCEVCGQKITTGAEYDHAIEETLTHDNSFENCVCMCGRCHARKTKDRRPEIDKTRRVTEKAMGLRKTKRGFPKAPAGYSTFTRSWKE
jgi:5-methylcytosine-specific restriction endonuclease McrA